MATLASLIDEDMEQEEQKLAAIPPPPVTSFPEVFRYPPPGELLLAANASTDSAIPMSVVRRLSEQDACVDESTGHSQHVFACAFIPCTIKADPVSLAQVVGDADELLPIEQGPGIRMWYALRLVITMALPRIMLHRASSLVVGCVNMHKDVKIDTSDICGLLFFVSFMRVPESLSNHIKESQDVFSGTRMNPALMSAAITKAMCLSVNSIQDAMRLHHDIGKLVAERVDQSCFSYLPDSWTRVLQSYKIRLAVLSAMEAIFYNKPVVDPDAPLSHTIRVDGRMKIYTHRHPEVLDAITNATSSGFEEWYVHEKIRFRGDCVAFGLHAVVNAFAPAHDLNPIQMDIVKGTTLIDWLLSPAQDDPRDAMHYLNRSSTLRGAMKEALWRGADPLMCDLAFFSRTSGFQHYDELPPAMQGESFFVTPCLFMHSSAIESCFVPGDTSSAAKAASALDGIVVTEPMSTDVYIENGPARTPRLVVSIINPCYHFALEFYAQPFRLINCSLGEHFMNGLRAVLHRPQDNPHFLHAVRVSQCRAEYEAEAVTTGDEADNHPLQFALAQRTRTVLSDMHQILPRFADVCAFQNHVAAEQSVPVTSGPGALIPPMTAANTLDMRSVHWRLPGASAAYLKTVIADPGGTRTLGFMDSVVESTAASVKSSFVSLRQHMLGVAARVCNYTPGNVQAAGNCAGAVAELWHRQDSAPKSMWPTMASHSSIASDLPESIRNMQIDPLFAMGSDMLPRYRNLGAGAYLMREIHHLTENVAGLKSCGEKLFIIRMCMLTSFFLRGMAAHLMIFGYTTSGKSACMRLCHNLGLTNFKMKYDSMSALSTQFGDESLFLRTVAFEEVKYDLVAQAVPQVQGSRNEAQANAASGEQTRHLVMLESAEVTRMRSEGVQRTRGSTVHSGFKTLCVRTNTMCQIAHTANIPAHNLSGPFSARVLPLLFAGGSSTSEPANLEVGTGSNPAAMLDRLGANILMFQFRCKEGNNLEMEVDSIRPYTNLLAQYAEEHSGRAARRHPMAQKPAFMSPLMERMDPQHTQSAAESNNPGVSRYHRARIYDLFTNTLPELSVYTRMTQLISWLSPVLMLVPDYKALNIQQLILQVYGVAGPEDVIWSAFMYGCFDTLLLASDFVAAARAVCMPNIRCFMFALAIHAYSNRWAAYRRVHPTKLQAQILIEIGLPPTMPETGVYIPARLTTLTPHILREALVDTKDNGTLFKELMAAPADFFFADHNMWITVFATYMVAALGSCMHPSRLPTIRPQAQRGPPVQPRAPVRPAPPKAGSSIQQFLRATPATSASSSVAAAIATASGSALGIASGAASSSASGAASGAASSSALTAVDPSAMPPTDFGALYAEKGLVRDDSSMPPPSPGSQAMRLRHGVSLLDADRPAEPDESTSPVPRPPQAQTTRILTLARVVHEATRALNRACALLEAQSVQDDEDQTTDVKPALRAMLRSLENKDAPVQMFLVPTAFQVGLLHPCDQLQNLWMSSKEAWFEALDPSALNVDRPDVSILAGLANKEHETFARDMQTVTVSEEQLLHPERWPVAPPPPPPPNTGQAGDSVAPAGAGSALFIATGTQGTNAAAGSSSGSQVGRVQQNVHGFQSNGQRPKPPVLTNMQQQQQQQQAVPMTPRDIEMATLQCLGNSMGRCSTLLQSLLPLNRIHVAPKFVMQAYGYTQPFTAVVIRPTLLITHMTTTETAIDQLLQDAGLANEVAPVFTYGFEMPVPSVCSSYCLRTKQIPAVQAGQTEGWIKLDPHTKAAASVRFDTLVKKGMLTEADLATRRVSNVADAQLWYLEARKNVMPGVYLLLRRSLQAGLLAYSHKLYEDDSSQLHANRVRDWFPKLEMALMRTPDCIRFMSEDLRLLDPLRLEDYTQSCSTKRAPLEIANRDLVNPLLRHSDALFQAESRRAHDHLQAEALVQAEAERRSRVLGLSRKSNMGALRAFHRKNNEAQRQAKEAANALLSVDEDQEDTTAAAAPDGAGDHDDNDASSSRKKRKHSHGRPKLSKEEKRQARKLRKAQKRSRVEDPSIYQAPESSLHPEVGASSSSAAATVANAPSVEELEQKHDQPPLDEAREPEHELEHKDEDAESGRGAEETPQREKQSKKHKKHKRRRVINHSDDDERDAQEEEPSADMSLHMHMGPTDGFDESTTEISSLFGMLQ